MTDPILILALEIPASVQAAIVVAAVWATTRITREVRDFIVEVRDGGTEKGGSEADEARRDAEREATLAQIVDLQERQTEILERTDRNIADLDRAIDGPRAGVRSTLDQLQEILTRQTSILESLAEGDRRRSERLEELGERAEVIEERVVAIEERVDGLALPPEA